MTATKKVCHDLMQSFEPEIKTIKELQSNESYKVRLQLHLNNLDY